jgi:hypothetical protein
MSEVLKPENLPVPSEHKEMMTLIERALIDPAITPEKLNGLYDFKLRLDSRAAEIEANGAFALVITKMPRIKKNGMIDYGKGQKPIPYGKWEDVQDAIRPVYEAEGFTLSFDNENREGGGLIVHAILRHANGHVFKSSMPVPLDTSGGKQNVQGMGSSSSYGQRYATKSLFNLVFEGEDDDGARAGIELITLEQCKVINALLESTKADTTRFFQYMEVAEVASVQKKDYARALNALGTKIVKGAEARS